MFIISASPAHEPFKRQQLSQLPAFNNSLNQVPDLSSILTQIQNSPWWQLLQQAFKPGTSNGGNSGSSPDTVGNNQAQSTECGKSDLNTDASQFIVGGFQAKEGEFPWQVNESWRGGRDVFLCLFLVKYNSNSI